MNRQNLSNQAGPPLSTLRLPLKWHNPEDKTACRIYTRVNANFLDRKLWAQQHDWLRDKLEIFHRVFAPIVKTLD